jgi:translation initiation factor IF-1
MTKKSQPGPRSDREAPGTGGIQGTVEEALPSALYRVKLDDGRKVVAGLATEARRTVVKVQPGDRVEVVQSPLDPTRGKITRRHS